MIFMVETQCVMWIKDGHWYILSRQCWALACLKSISYKVVINSCVLIGQIEPLAGSLPVFTDRIGGYV